MLDVRATSRVPAILVAEAMAAMVPMPVVFGVRAGISLGLAAAVLAAIAAVDATSHRIPNRLVVAAGGVLLVGSASLGTEAFGASVVVGVLWFSALLVVHLLDPRLGFGDVKLAAVLGMMIGFGVAAAGHDLVAGGIVSAAAFLAAATATGAVAARRPGQAVPFAPALVAAVVIATAAVGVFPS